MELKLRSLALLGSLAMLGLSACETHEGPAKLAPTPAEAGSLRASPAQSPAPPGMPLEPLQPAPGRLVAAQGRVSVPIPEQPGWECLEEQHGEHEATAVALRCRREDPREFLFFSAKTNRQPADQRTDAQTVLMSLYRADNEAFFAQVEYLEDHPASLAGAQGWEAELVAEHARLGPIRKRERLAIVGDRVFAISAEGAPAQWAAHEAEIERWFAGVEFAR